MKKWYIEKGDQGDVVLSTRIRLARNLEAYPFPSRLDVEGKKKVCIVGGGVGGKSSGTGGCDDRCSSCSCRRARWVCSSNGSAIGILLSQRSSSRSCGSSRAN